MRKPCFPRRRPLTEYERYRILALQDGTVQFDAVVCSRKPSVLRR